MPSLLSEFTQVFLLLGMLSGLLLFLWLPYMAWSVTRNVRQIRQQLERLNDTLEGQTSGARSGPLRI